MRVKASTRLSSLVAIHTIDSTSVQWGESKGIAHTKPHTGSLSSAAGRVCGVPAENYIRQY
jgi:hypothetical protein